MPCKTSVALASAAVFGFVHQAALAQQTAATPPVVLAAPPAPAAAEPMLNEITVTATRTERRVDDVPGTVTGTTPAYASPSYTVLDLGASWKLLPNLTLFANINNVFDATYWRWSDVRGLADNSPVKDAFTAPGRNLQGSARLDF